MIKSARVRGLLLAGLLLLGLSLQAQTNSEWTLPVAPFRIAGNLYYVGG